MNDNKIKNEGEDLLSQGYSVSDAIHILYQKYCHNKSVTYRDFDGKYGRYLRRIQNNRGVLTMLKKPTVEQCASQGKVVNIQSALEKKEFDGKYGRYLRRIQNNRGVLTMLKKPTVEQCASQGKVVNIQSALEKKEVEKKADGTIKVNCVEKAHGNAIPTDEEIMIENDIDPTKYQIDVIRKSSWDAQTPDGIERLNSYRVTCSPKKPSEFDFIKALNEKIQSPSPIAIPRVHRKLSDEIARLNSYRVTCSPKKPSEFDFIKALNEKIQSPSPIAIPRVHRKLSDEIAIVAIPDLHLGKFAEEAVCGVSYNVEKAKKAFFQVIEDSIEMIKVRDRVEKIILYWSQDFFHYDTSVHTTTAGTFQHTDIGWQEMFSLGLSMLIDGIQMLSQIAPVETFYTKSNHDTMTGFHAAASIAKYFENYDNITVNATPISRKYIRYGVNLFGFAHGDKEKKRIEGLMQQEAAEDWGKTKFREWFLGHYHSLRQYETNGIVFRYLQSPTGTDEWHKDCGFVGAWKCGYLFIRNGHYHSLRQYETNGIVFRYLQSPTGTDEWHKDCGFVGAWKCGYLFIRNKEYGPVLEMPLMVLEDRQDGRENIIRVASA